MDNLIPNINREIDFVLKKLELKPVVSPKKFIKKTKGNKHRYSSLCFNSKKERVLFYARLHKNLDAKKKMLRETSFLKIAKKEVFEVSEYLPKIYLGKKEKSFEWLTREYFLTSPLGKNEQLKKNVTKNDAELIAQALYKIKKVSPLSLKSVKLEKFPAENYLDSINLISSLIEKKVLNKKEADKIIKLFKENESLLKKEVKYFCHGDLNLGNIIISKGKLKIIDWELIQINSFAFDIAYLFTHFWQAKKPVRNTFLKTYINLLSKKEKVVFKKLFPIIIFYLAVGGLEAKPQEIKTQLLKQRRGFFKKLLQGCAFGFRELIKI